MFGLFELLDYILPSTEIQKHDISRLEYLSACKTMENDNYMLKILPHMPPGISEILLQSVIYKCYREFINISSSSVMYFHRHLDNREIAFPKTLRTLIINWPCTELVLRHQIPPLHPPVEIFQSYYGSLVKQNELICQVEIMLRVFRIFCTKLIRFITQAVFKSTLRNTHGFSCKLRKIDVSGLGSFCSEEEYEGFDENTNLCFSRLDDILKLVRKSKFNTLGHKIEIFADAEIKIFNSIGQYTAEYKLLSNIIEANVNPKFGISMFFKKIGHDESFNSLFFNNGQLPSDVCKDFALGRCECVHLNHLDMDRNAAETLQSYLPKLVGMNISLPKRKSVGLDFIHIFENIEQLGVSYYKHDFLINSISNMIKGLLYLDLLGCSLHSKDLECLASSIHSDTLKELNLSYYEITNDSAIVGLIMLCQKLNNVKVLKLEGCSLDTLSSNAVSEISNAFKDCVKLEFLSMRQNPFSVEKTNMIISGLAQKKSLRYLSLDIPEHRYDLSKTFHETINKCRDSPIYISWYI